MVLHREGERRVTRGEGNVSGLNLGLCNRQKGYCIESNGAAGVSGHDAVACLEFIDAGRRAVVASDHRTCWEARLVIVIVIVVIMVVMVVIVMVVIVIVAGVACVAVVRRARKSSIAVEPALHLLDLLVLHINDRPDEGVAEGLFVGRVIGGAVKLGERLGHRDSILVMRDHLARERGKLGDTTTGGNRDGHLMVHLAVDLLQTCCVVAGRAGAAEEMRGLTFGARRCSVRVVRAACLVIVVDCLLISRNNRIVDGYC